MTRQSGMQVGGAEGQPGPRPRVRGTLAPVRSRAGRCPTVQMRRATLREVNECAQVRFCCDKSRICPPFLSARLAASRHSQTPGL